MTHQRRVKYCIFYMGNELDEKETDYRLLLRYTHPDDTEDLSYLLNITWETCIRFRNVYMYTRSLYTQEYFLIM